MDPELEQNNNPLEDEFYKEDPVGQTLAAIQGFQDQQQQQEVADQQEATELDDPRE